MLPARVLEIFVLQCLETPDKHEPKLETDIPQGGMKKKTKQRARDAMRYE